MQSGRRGLPVWMHQRARRLSAMGLTPGAIAASLGIVSSVAQRSLLNEPDRRYSRCGGCGGWTTTPCVLCSVRRWVSERTAFDAESE